MICSPMKRRSLILLLTIAMATQWAVSFPSKTRAARLLPPTAGGVSRERNANRATGSTLPQLLAHLPMRFEANTGQTDAEVKYLARGPNYAIFFKPAEVVVALQAPLTAASALAKRSVKDARSSSSVLRMKLVGGDPRAKVSGLEQTTERRSYFIGRDPKKWRTNVAGYTRVTSRSVYPGIDAVFYGNAGQLEYDLVVASQADPNRITLAFEGAKALRIEASGTLVATTETGELRQPRPVAYQQQGELRREIQAGYEVCESQQVRIRLGDYDATRPLVIDPVLVYSTAFGSTDNDRATAIAVDAAGNTYIAGSTPSSSFPTKKPIQPPDQLPFIQDAFVAKLNPAGDALIYSTYLGGSFSDFANAIAVDGQGNAYVAGATDSSDFPTTPGAFQTSAPSGNGPNLGDAFVTKLNPTGTALVYSTFLGGQGDFLSGFDAAAGIAVDDSGSAYITGSTFSSSFPTKRALFPKLNRGFLQTCCACIVDFSFAGVPLIDAFLTKLNPSGSSLVYSTYLGGSGQDGGRAVAVDVQGNAYVAGETCSPDFPFPGGILPIANESHIFLLKVSASGRSIVYLKTLKAARIDAPSSVAVDASGNAYVTGETQSEDLPVTAGALQAKLGGSIAFKTSDSAVTWSAINSSLPNQTISAIAVDPTNPATLYAASAFAVFKSLDAGASWFVVLFNSFRRFPDGDVRYIAIDPIAPATVYAGAFKSTNSGSRWSDIVLPTNTHFVNVLAIDPKNGSTVYAGTGGSSGDTANIGFVLKSTDGGTHWRPPTVSSGSAVLVLFIDPKTPTTLYACVPRLLKSTDGGETWKATGLDSTAISAAAIDPTDPLTIYAGVNLRTDARLVKSTDGGATWKPTGLSGISINAIAVDPTDSSIVYAGVGDQGEGGGLFKSTDGGDNWVLTSLTSMTVQSLSIAQLDPATVYAGAFEDIDAFVMKFDPSGGLVYSTYLGGAGHDRGTGIGVDSAGNAYVAGRTLSDRFPIKDAVKPEKFLSPSASSIFVTKLALKTNTASLVYSTYLGGNEPGGATGIVVDGAGKVYVTGTTGFRASLAFTGLDVTHASEDVFAAKLVTPPIITGASVKRKKLTVDGEGFDDGAVILLNGEPQKTRNDEDAPNLRVIAKKAGKLITRGVPITLQVRNSDGLISASFSFTRE